VFRPRDMAHTLEDIAATGGESLYRGELAAKIVSAAAGSDGAMARDDLAAHHSEWVKPLSQNWQGATVCELPPNGQGVIVLIALGILNHLHIEQYPIDSADSLHLQIEAMKAAFATARPHVADPAWMTLQPSSLLDVSFLEERARMIRMDRSAYSSDIQPDGGTVYLTTADENGMKVSYIQSNYHGFGSGIVIPGTGIALQNRGAGFTLEEGHPNQVAGGKRPFHTIIPGFVMKDGLPLMSFGVMGAHMQAQGHVQMTIRILAYGQNPQTAADAPRWYLTEDSRLSLEPGIGPAVRKELQRRGHQLAPDQPTAVFGGAQLIYRLPGGYCAASDPRKDGQAVGF
jgi:gamma-glutamyltranspeptidase / glutathione hydrolase